MKALRIICLFLALGTATVALAANPTGVWKWTTHSPTGDIDTTLKLESVDGKLAGAYSNQFGDTAISNISLQGDVIAFDVVRNFDGNKYAVKYRGKIEGDTIKGTIEAPGHDGGEALKLEWNAKRTAAGDAQKP
jgi:carbon monoxide dehydrogenase subunit G